MELEADPAAYKPAGLADCLGASRVTVMDNPARENASHGRLTETACREDCHVLNMVLQKFKSR
jgi:hypothetical protein